MTMLESDNDWTLAYDFDKLTLRKKESLLRWFLRDSKILWKSCTAVNINIYICLSMKKFIENNETILFLA